MIIHVAVAVIHYNDQYLLGFRNVAQHQGDRYEFVGGKIEADESAEQALIREVNEETGIAIHHSTIVKLGRLHHDYGDKQVSLQVYKVTLTARQYQQYKYCQYGLEGQALAWVAKSDLLAGQYHLPDANKTILTWLSLPTQISITYPLAHFSSAADPEIAWLDYHYQRLAPESLVYLRTKAADAEHIAAQLLHQRPDIKAILPDDSHYQRPALSTQIVAQQVSHRTLLQWVADQKNGGISALQLSTHQPLILSCHNAASITAANTLAHTRLQQQLPPVLGMFLSPVLRTQTHPDSEPLGWASWADLAQLADVPVIGLGGLSPTMIDQALQHGGVSVAGIRRFLRAE